MMFKRKIYLVEWQDEFGGYNSDIIKAKDPAEAWGKIRKRYPITSKCVLKVTLYKEIK